MDGREGLRGLGQRPTRSREGGQSENSEALCSYARHWETHSNTFTHSHTDTVVHTSACFCPPPHRLALASRKGSPVSSPVCWVSHADRPDSSSVHLTSDTQPQLFSSPAGALKWILGAVGRPVATDPTPAKEQQRWTAEPRAAESSKPPLR